MRRGGAPVDGRRFVRSDATLALEVPRDRVVDVGRRERRGVFGCAGDGDDRRRPGGELVRVGVIRSLLGVRVRRDDAVRDGRRVDRVAVVHLPRDRVGADGIREDRVVVGRTVHGRERIERRSVRDVGPAGEREVRGHRRLLGRRLADVDRRGAVGEVRLVELRRAVRGDPDDRGLVELDGVGHGRSGAGRDDLVGRGGGRDERRVADEGAVGGIDRDGLARGEGDGRRARIEAGLQERDRDIVGLGLVRGREGREGVDHVRVRGGADRGDVGDVLDGDDVVLDHVGAAERDRGERGHVGERDRVDLRVVRARGVERDAVDVVADGRGLRREVVDREVVGLAGGGLDAEELGPGSVPGAVDVVGVEGGLRVARQLQDGETGLRVADLGLGLEAALRHVDRRVDADRFARGGGDLVGVADAGDAHVGELDEIVGRGGEERRGRLRVEHAFVVGRFGERGFALLGRDGPGDTLVPVEIREGEGPLPCRPGPRSRRRGVARTGENAGGRQAHRGAVAGYRRVNRGVGEREGELRRDRGRVGGLVGRGRGGGGKRVRIDGARGGVLPARKRVGVLAGRIGLRRRGVRRGGVGLDRRGFDGRAVLGEPDDREGADRIDRERAGLVGHIVVALHGIARRRDRVGAFRLARFARDRVGNRIASDQTGDGRRERGGVVLADGLGGIVRLDGDGGAADGPGDRLGRVGRVVRPLVVRGERERGGVGARVRAGVAGDRVARAFRDAGLLRAVVDEARDRGRDRGHGGRDRPRDRLGGGRSGVDLRRVGPDGARGIVERGRSGVGTRGDAGVVRERVARAGRDAGLRRAVVDEARLGRRNGDLGPGLELGNVGRVARDRRVLRGRPPDERVERVVVAGFGRIGGHDRCDRRAEVDLVRGRDPVRDPDHVVLVLRRGEDGRVRRVARDRRVRRRRPLLERVGELRVGCLRRVRRGHGHGRAVIDTVRRVLRVVRDPDHVELVDRPIGDELDVGGEDGVEVIVGVVQLPRAERVVGQRHASRLGGRAAGRDALRRGIGRAAVRVERHVVAGLDDPVAVAVVDSHEAVADKRHRGLGRGTAGGIVAQLRIVANERAAVDHEVPAFQVVLDVESQCLQGGLPPVRTRIGVLEGAAVDGDHAVRVAHVDGRLFVVLAGERAAVDHDVAALGPDRAALRRLGRHGSAVGRLDRDRAGGGGQHVAVRTPRLAVEVDCEAVGVGVDNPFVHIREQQDRLAVLRGGERRGKRRVDGVRRAGAGLGVGHGDHRGDHVDAFVVDGRIGGVGGDGGGRGPRAGVDFVVLRVGGGGGRRSRRGLAVVERLGLHRTAVVGPRDRVAVGRLGERGHIGGIVRDRRLGHRDPAREQVGELRVAVLGRGRGGEGGVGRAVGNAVGFGQRAFAAFGEPDDREGLDGRGRVDVDVEVRHRVDEGRGVRGQEDGGVRVLRDRDGQVVAFGDAGNIDDEVRARHAMLIGGDARDRQAFGRRDGDDGPLRGRLVNVAVDRIKRAGAGVLHVVGSVMGRIHGDLGAIDKRGATGGALVFHQPDRGGGARTVVRDERDAGPDLGAAAGVGLDLGRHALGDFDAALEFRRRIVEGLDERVGGNRRLADDLERCRDAVGLVPPERDVVQDVQGADRQVAGIVVVEEADVVHAERTRAGHGAALVAAEVQEGAARAAGGNDRDVGIDENRLLAPGGGDRDIGIVREGHDRRRRRDVADVPVGRNVPVAGRAADPGGRREAGRGVVRDERDVGRRSDGEVVVGVVELPCAERIGDRVVASLRRVGGGSRHETAGRDALRGGRRVAAVGVERHVVAGLDDEVAVAVVDGDEALVGEVGHRAGVVAKLRVVLRERAALDEEVLRGVVRLVNRHAGNGRVVAVGRRRDVGVGAALDGHRRAGERIGAGAAFAVDRDGQIGERDVRAGARGDRVDAVRRDVRVVLRAVDDAVRDQHVAALHVERAAVAGRAGAGDRVPAEIDRDRGVRTDVRVDALRERHVAEQQDRAAVRGGGDGVGERRVVAHRVGGGRAVPVVGNGEDRGRGRGGRVGRRVGGHRAVVGGGRRVPREERVHGVVRDVARGIGVRRGSAPVDGRRVGRVDAVGGLVVPRDRVVAVDGREDRVVGRSLGGAGQRIDHAAAGGGRPAGELVGVGVVLRLGRRAGVGRDDAGQDLGGRGRALDVPRDREGVLVPGRPVGDGAGRTGGDRRLDARGDVVRPAVERVAFATGREERDRQVGDRVGIRERVRDGVRGAGEVEVPHDRVLDEADGVGRDGALRFGEDRVAGAGGGDDGLGLGEGALRSVDLDGVADGEIDRAGDVVREEVEGLDAGLVGGGEAGRGGGVGRIAHGGLERHVVFGDDGRDDAVRVGEADAVDDGRLALFHRQRVHVRARVVLIESNALDVVAGGLSLDIEHDEQVVRRVRGGRGAGELVPGRAVEGVEGGGGIAVVRDLGDREAGAGLADIGSGGQFLHRALGDLEAGLDADHLTGGGRRIGLDALHALGEVVDFVKRVRRDVEPLGLALRVEAAGQRLGGALGGELPVDGLVPGQAREGGVGDSTLGRERDVRVRRGHHGRGIDRHLDRGAGRAARDDGRGDRILREGDGRTCDGVELRRVGGRAGDGRNLRIPAGERVGVLAVGGLDRIIARVGRVLAIGHGRGLKLGSVVVLEGDRVGAENRGVAGRVGGVGRHVDDRAPPRPRVVILVGGSLGRTGRNHDRARERTVVVLRGGDGLVVLGDEQDRVLARSLGELRDVFGVAGDRAHGG